MTANASGSCQGCGCSHCSWPSQWNLVVSGVTASGPPFGWPNGTYALNFAPARFDTSGWSRQQVFDTEGMGWELNCVENVGFVLQIGMSNNAIGGNESTIVWSIPLGEVQCMVPITLANPVVANNIEAGITFTAWPATITVTPA